MSQRRVTGRPAWAQTAFAVAMMALAGAAAASTLLAVGCNRDDRPTVAEAQPSNLERGRSAFAATGAPATTAAPPADSAQKNPGGSQAGNKLSEPNFDLSLKPSGEYRVGKQALVKVVLDAKGPYKPNDKYPYKFKLQQTAGIKYERLVVRKDAIKLEKKRATMTVKLTPQAAGPQRVSGKFFFSVCTDKKCLIERRDLALDIKVR